MTNLASGAATFDLACRDCTRLATFLDSVRERYPDYHAAPVAPFGDPDARLLVIGLAPGMHGANRTGRPFTGDYAGILLYQTLYRHGFASQALGAAVDDGLKLLDCRISNAVKCLPPDNKPTGQEVRACNRYLAAELAGPGAPRVLVALGKVAHEAVLRALELRPAAYPFGHGASYQLPDGRRLLASYHCSRYNTNTRRLTPEMFDAVLAAARDAVSALLPTVSA
jgi:uracil-DNA glycosylase family 4